MNDLKNLAAWVGIVGTLVMLALVERLRRTFATTTSHEELKERVSALEARMLETPSAITVAVRAGNNELREWIRMEMNGIGTRLDRYEKLTLGAQDVAAENRNRIEALEQHGGSPISELHDALEDIRLQLREQSTDIKWLRRQRGGTE
jgi:hypothetical protein